MPATSAMEADRLELDADPIDGERDLAREDPLALLARRLPRVGLRTDGEVRSRVAVEGGAVDDPVVDVAQRLVLRQLVETHAVADEREHHRGLVALGVSRIELR